MLTRVDRELLVALLLYGDNSRSNLATIIDRHPNSISDARERLEEEDLIHDKGSGVLALTIPGLRAAQQINRSAKTSFDPDFDVSDLFPGDQDPGNL